MYKVYQDLSKNPTTWGVFSRKSTTGNEKSLHSAPHHNRPSHTTVTIKWIFLWDEHNQNSTQTPLQSQSYQPPIQSIPSSTPSPTRTLHLPHTTPHLPRLPITLRSNLSNLKSLYYLSSIFYPICSLSHSYL